MKKSLQELMFSEAADKTLFKKASEYGMNYWAASFDRNVFPTEEALRNLSLFDTELPQQTGNSEEILAFLEKYGSPATVTQIGGRYFGFVNGSSIPVGLAAKNLAIYWDQNTAMQVLSPLASKLEMTVERWLRDLLGLPEKTIAGFVSGTSLANFSGLAAARYRILRNQGWDITRQGLMDAPRIRIVTGKEAHSAVLKAISLLGLGIENIEWIDTDDQGRIIPGLIPSLDNSTLLILQAGNVHSGSFDDFKKICKKARDSGAWIHIDGAFGLWAGATQKFKHLTTGFESAHSWALDAHKTLNTPYDSGIVLCSDEEAFVSALHMSGDYIIHGKDRDGMFYTPEMSRRARVIELWATLKYLGREGIEELVTGLHERAKQFADELSELDGFEILNDVVFNQVIAACETDNLTDQTVDKIQEIRECWVGGSAWQGRRVIRISICSWATTKEDVTRSVRSFQQALQQVKEEAAADA